MTYLESLNYINNNLTSGSVYGLSRIKELLKRLDNPQKCMSIIHIAGTNGKGSISRMIMSILKAAGYTVGIFNSPYLEKKNEYLCVNGVDATDDEYALIAGIAKRAVEGVPMEEKEFHCKGEFKGVHKGRPNEDDMKAAAEFAKTFIK